MINVGDKVVPKRGDQPEYRWNKQFYAVDSSANGMISFECIPGSFYYASDFKVVTTLDILAKRLADV